ncbi:MAG: XRE family transcriptional regulator [Prevotellaceae bacterium]|nr:XRE family transcriptional regulator [Prevotellaceae bacterium]
MNEDPIKQIAERLRGLREALELTPEQMAQESGIAPDVYLKAESGEYDLSVSMLRKIAQRYRIPLDTLMFDSEPTMSTYFVTRSGQGVAVERTKAYKYQSLASGFRDRRGDPYIVTIEPKENESLHINSHAGQEFNYVIEGSMLLSIDNKEIILNTGDSIYFDSGLPHAMKALYNSKACFLAIIL